MVPYSELNPNLEAMQTKGFSPTPFLHSTPRTLESVAMRHLPLAGPGPRIPCYVLWGGAAFPDLYKVGRGLAPNGIAHR